VLGGEEVVQGDLTDFTRTLPTGCDLVNGYGPTECTIALQHRTRPSDRGRPSIPIGHPVGHVDVTLADAAGQPAEVFGEIVLRGPYVAPGYHERPDDNRRSFGTDDAGGWFYRTGDLAYRLPDGALVFRGRRDQQVKIRGQRVEPAEAESLLRAHPTVDRAAVIADQRDGGRVELVAYVTSPTPMPAVPDELLAYLARHLPAHLVPGHVIVVDNFPVGPTGKLDRTRLPVPSRRPPGPADDEPRTQLEKAVAALWREVLGLDSVGVRDNFVNLGGDSAQVMTLLARLGGHGIELSLLDFLTDPTIERIVQHRTPTLSEGT
jgi:acyl-CoA synthetase (AMP-forming)/AMP-acid ligase II/aryl carrier-like protein